MKNCIKWLVNKANEVRDATREAVRETVAEVKAVCGFGGKPSLEAGGLAGKAAVAGGALAASGGAAMAQGEDPEFVSVVDGEIVFEPSVLIDKLLPIGMTVLGGFVLWIAFKIGTKIVLRFINRLS